ncbi:MAG TPA: Nif3-like dinuclear metal center hexameric protein [Gemmatimonadales bacterium]|nr:Nif3-like dinuclear metal center hexameric protein [Gemmatimonadales bacterium]
MKEAALADVVGYLDGLLGTANVPDYDGAMNGLQFANGGVVTGLVAAVDASMRTIEQVVAECAPGTLLLVHHGLFWSGSAPVTGRRYHKVKMLLDHDIAVYASHIPLDVHPMVGNNAVLARLLDIVDPVSFDEYRGIPFGAAGPLIMPRDTLVARLAELLTAPRVHLVAGGPQTTLRVGIITGAAGDRVHAAARAGLDTFITGEGAHHTANEAIELGLNVIYAGHYATETVGVKALAEHLSEQFDLPWLFHDHPTGL